MQQIRLAALAACLLTVPAMAADPESGAITDAQTAVEWTGGPFFVPNLTPTLGLAGLDPVCEEGTPTCDVFRFEVNLTTANVDDDSVVIRVGWDGATDIGGVVTVPDYDLYLYDDTTGDLIITQASAANPEVITVGAQNRKYRLVIIPFADTGVAYHGRAELVKFEAQSTLFGGSLALGALLVLAGLGAWRRR